MSGVLIAAVFILQTGGPTHKHWDTGAPITAALNNKNLDRPISLTDPSTEEETCGALDMDHYIVVDQYGNPTGQQGGGGNVPLSYQWSCSAGSVTQGVGGAQNKTTWTAPATGGFYDIECALDDGEPWHMGEGDTGTRNDAVAYAGYANDTERALAVKATSITVAGSGSLQGDQMRFNATDDGDDLYCTVPGDPTTAGYHGFMKRVEVRGSLSPALPEGRWYLHDFCWRQDKRGVMWDDAVEWERCDVWTNDDPFDHQYADGSWFITQDDVPTRGDWRVFMSDGPGRHTDSEGNAGTGEHTARMRNPDDTGPYEFRNAVLYLGWRVSEGWDDTPEWTRNLLLYSNASTGNKWAVNANE